jgi:hypothetical protein
MSESSPIKPEKKESLEDNARKFTVARIDQGFLMENKASSFELTVDWLVTEKSNEKKLAYKKFPTGDVQILLITKVTNGDSRTSDKRKIHQTEYERLLGSSILHLEKKRYEFNATQGDITFLMKYDEFAGGSLSMLEVDAGTEEERSKFKPEDFPYSLGEVTGDMRYYGYRVTGML